MKILLSKVVKKINLFLNVEVIKKLNPQQFFHVKIAVEIYFSNDIYIYI